MGVHRLRPADEQPVENDEITSYADIVWIVRSGARARMRLATRAHGAYTIPHPKNKDAYATVELTYAGDFRDTKDPFAYVLASLGHD